MSIFEQAIRIFSKDIEQEANLVSQRIIGTNMAPDEYVRARVSYGVLVNIKNYLDKSLNKILLNPDMPLPETFVEPNSGTPDPEEQEPEATVHTVDIESGAVSQGSN